MIMSNSEQLIYMLYMLLHVIHYYLNILMKHLKFILSNILSEGLDVVCVCLLCLIAVIVIFCECLLIEVHVQHGGEWLAQTQHSKKVPWILYMEFICSLSCPDVKVSVRVTRAGCSLHEYF